MFAAELMRPALGILLYLGAGLLGWFVHPLIAIVIFIFMVALLRMDQPGRSTRPIVAGNGQTRLLPLFAVLLLSTR